MEEEKLWMDLSDQVPVDWDADFVKILQFVLHFGLHVCSYWASVGTLGAPLDPFWTQVATGSPKNAKRPQNLVPFGSHFGDIFATCGASCLSHFLDTFRKA